MNIFTILMRALALVATAIPAMAEEGWEVVRLSLERGKAVVLLPLQSEIYSELTEEQPPPQPELHFSGAEGGGVNVAQATLAFPPISVREQVILSPFLAFNGQDDGTIQGQTLAGEGGLVLSLGGRIQAKFAWERTIHPFPFTTFMVNASFHF